VFEAVVTSCDNVATNGVVHIIDRVLIPPVNDLIFRGVKKATVFRQYDQCGEVNAGPRVPVALFEPSNAAVLQAYVDITIKLYELPGSALDVLELGKCEDIGYHGFPIVNQVTWAPPLLMDGICAQQCQCNFPGQKYPANATLPACTDQPDDPAAAKWCSLCGPKYNQKINIVFRKTK